MVLFIRAYFQCRGFFPNRILCLPPSLHCISTQTFISPPRGSLAARVSFSICGWKLWRQYERKKIIYDPDYQLLMFPTLGFVICVFYQLNRICILLPSAHKILLKMHLQYLERLVELSLWFYIFAKFLFLQIKF